MYLSIQDNNVIGFVNGASTVHTGVVEDLCLEVPTKYLELTLSRSII